MWGIFPSLNMILSQHPLDLFSISFPYRVSLATLTETYVALQKQWHPDRFVTASPEEQKKAAEYASHVNAAYGVLKIPLRRWEAILIYLRAPLDRPVSVEILEQNMAYRETLSSLEESGYEGFRHFLENEGMRIEEEFYQAIQANDLGRAVIAFYRLTYLTRLLEQVPGEGV